MLDNAVGMAVATLGYEGFPISMDFHVDFLGKVKIKEIETYLMDAAQPQTRSWSARNWLFVRVLTDEGSCGVGEASGWPRVVETAVKDLAPLLIGDPTLHEGMRSRLHESYNRVALLLAHARCWTLPVKLPLEPPPALPFGPAAAPYEGPLILARQLFDMMKEGKACTLLTDKNPFEKGSIEKS